MEIPQSQIIALIGQMREINELKRTRDACTTKLNEMQYRLFYEYISLLEGVLIQNLFSQKEEVHE